MMAMPSGSTDRSLAPQRQHDQKFICPTGARMEQWTIIGVVASECGIDSKRRSGALIMSFYIGQQVVCVSEKFTNNTLWRQTVRSIPKLNGIYTIRDMYEWGGRVGLYFYEIVSPSAQFIDGYGEPCFNSKNFRPVERTSIEIFEKLLAPADPAGASRKQRRAKPLVLA
jgi:hypothetical protein